MAVWWESLSALQRVFACFALPATFVLIIQTVLVLFGIGDHGADAGGSDAGGMDAGGMDAGGMDAGGMDAGGMHAGGMDVGGIHDCGTDASGAGPGDTHGGGFHGDDASSGLALLSIRGIMAFFTVGGWAGIVMAGIVASPFLSVTAALIAGAVALYGVALLFKWAARLQSAGNVSMKYAVGKTAKVYIAIPGGKKGFGKVLLTFQGRFTECDAVSDTDADLKAGQLVRVIGLADEDTLVVAPLDEEKIDMR
jgi:hypothetical protein